MNVNKIVMGAIGIMVAVVMIAGAFLPAVSSALDISGDQVKYYNDDSQSYRPVVVGDVLEGTRTTENDVIKDVWELNGVQITNFEMASTNWTTLIFSDGCYGRILGENNNNIAEVYVIGDSLNAKYCTYIKMTFGASDITLIATMSEATNTYTIPYTWAYIPCLPEEGKYYAGANSTNAYVLDTSPIILCGLYETGELDTYYYSNNIELSLSNDYSGEINKTYTKVDGTTDIYTLDIQVEISNDGTIESFNPYQILVPYEIIGHSSGGVVYSMFSILPIVGVAGLVIAGVYVFISRK